MSGRIETVSCEFQVEARDGTARRGRLITPHGVVETPVFMPVGTLATVKGVPQDVLEELGVEILLSNTYHLYLRPGAEMVRRLGGLHRFMGWERAILTDSGGFQVWSLADLLKVSEEGVEFRSHLDGSLHRLGPESATAAQIALGADILMAFDECTEYPADKSRARQSMELTLRWAERCKRYFEEHKWERPWNRDDGRRLEERELADSRSSFGNAHSAEWSWRSLRDGRRPEEQPFALSGSLLPNDRRGESAPADQPPTKNDSSAVDRRPSTVDSYQSLFGIVQGGMHPELRRESAQRTVEIEFPGYAIGGLSVGEPRELTREIVSATLECLPADKPRYLMGVGTPEEIVEYAGLGVDMMDCVLPTRAARHGLLYTSEGKVAIKNARYASDEGPLDPQCACRVCARYSRAYLRHLYASNELLAQVLNTVHNLAHYLDTMRRVRHSISLGEFTKFLSGIRSRELNSPMCTPARRTPRRAGNPRQSP